MSDKLVKNGNMSKNKWIIGIGLVIIIALVGVKGFIKHHEKFDGAWIEGKINGNVFSITIENNEKFSELDYANLKSICLSNRKDGIDISSEEAIKLGNPTNNMMMSLFYDTDLISTKVYKYNLWIGNNTGYIQNKKDDKIYKLNSNENKFFIDCFLKYYNEEDIRKFSLMNNFNILRTKNGIPLLRYPIFYYSKLI